MDQAAGTGPSIVLCPLIEPFVSADGTLYLLPPPGDAEQMAVAAPWGAYVLQAAEQGLESLVTLSADDQGTVRATLEALVEAGLAIPRDRVESPDTSKYDRQVRYFAQSGLHGPQTQRRLRDQRVLLIGVGGIGSAVADALVRAGLGAIILVDFDVVGDENLARQTLYTASDVGRPKVDAAAARLRAISDDVTVDVAEEHIRSTEQVVALLDEYRPAVIAALADTPPYSLKKWINEAAFARGVPLVMGGQRAPLAYVGPMIVPGRTPCFECFDAHYTIEEVAELNAELDRYRDISTWRIPALGSGDAVVGNLVASDIVGLLSGSHPPATMGRELEIDLRTFQTRWIGAARPDCAVCHERGAKARAA